MIKKLDTVEELQQLIMVFSLAFKNDYTVSDPYLQSLLQNDSATVLGAYVEKELVGGLVAFEILPIHGSKEMYIYDIAVHPGHQKQGIGKKLIEHLQQIAKEKGVKTIFVEAEAEDDHAVAFYRALGGEEVLVNHFNFNV